jgi:hypothetical protein
MIVVTAPSAYLRDASYFFISELMPRVRSLEIDIVYRGIIEEGVWGYCFQNSKRSYEIQLALSLDSKETRLKTLAHELVHVKQYYCGELKNFTFESVFWKGVEFHGDSHSNESPWEEEALQLEEELYRKLLMNK